MNIGELLQDKKFLFGIVGVSALALFMKGKNDENSVPSLTANKGEGTVFVPTTHYDVEIVEGNKSVQTTTNSNNPSDLSTNTGVVDKPPATTTTTPPPKTVAPPITTAKPTVPKVPNQSQYLINTYNTAKASGNSGLMKWAYAESLKTSYDEKLTNPVSTKNVSYTVKKGDTLSAIAKKYYGTTAKATQIAKDNGIANVNKINVGQKLTLKNVK